MSEAARALVAILNQPLPEMVWESTYAALQEIEAEDEKRFMVDHQTRLAEYRERKNRK